MSSARSPRALAVLRTLASLWSPLDFEPVAPTATLPYGPPRRGRPPMGDVTVAAEGSGASALLVHGGGFIIGSRRMKPIRYLTTALSRRGVTTFAIDYRMPFRGGRLAEGVLDVEAATGFWQRVAPTYGARSDAITLIGLSAGGALTTLAAATAPVAAHVGVFGLYDFTHLGGPIAGLIPRLACGTARREVWSASSPIRRALATVPTLLIHGTDDALVPYGQAEAMSARRRDAGLPTWLERIEGAPHAFFNRPGPFADQALDAMVGFIHGQSGRGS